MYVLRSEKNGKRYIGFTSKDAGERLLEHNSGSCQFTRRNGPFKLIYADSFENSRDAREAEKFLKSGQGRQCLDELGI